MRDQRTPRLSPFEAMLEALYEAVASDDGDRAEELRAEVEADLCRRERAIGLRP